MADQISAGVDFLSGFFLSRQGDFVSMMRGVFLWRMLET